MKRFSTALLFTASALLASPVFAQQPPDKPPVTEAGKGGKTEAEKLPDGGRMIRTYDAQGGVVGEQLVPPGQAGGVEGSDHVIGNGGGFFNAQVFVRPRRLAPGEVGDLHVFVTLRGSAVVVPGAKMELKYDKTQGPLVCGEYRLEPAERGTRQSAFKGKPIYDDALEFKIPVTVAKDAKKGFVPFKAVLFLTVTNGKDGSALGYFTAEAPGRIKIGRSVPRPNPMGGGKKATNANTNKVVQPKKSSGNGGSKAAPKPRGRSNSPGKATGEGHLTGQENPEGQDPELGYGPEEAGDASGLPVLVIVGAGGLLLLLILLLLLKRR